MESNVVAFDLTRPDDTNETPFLPDAEWSSTRSEEYEEVVFILGP